MTKLEKLRSEKEMLLSWGIDFELLESMELAREAVRLGLNARSQANIKVRQPLPSIHIFVKTYDDRKGMLRHIDIIKDELNVKEVIISATL